LKGDSYWKLLESEHAVNLGHYTLLFVGIVTWITVHSKQEI